MAIRLTTDQIIKTAIAVLLAAWAALLLTGCVTMDNRDAEIAGLKIAVDQREAEVNALKVHVEKLTVQVAATIDESASPTTTAGDNSTITNVSLGGSGVMALMLAGLLWRHRTAVGALDRVLDVIESHNTESVTGIKDAVAKKGTRDPGQQDFRVDRIEDCIQSRLAKMKKP